MHHPKARICGLWYLDQKHGVDRRRQRRKVHLGIEAATLEIRAIEVTDNATGDESMLPCLLDQIPIAETVASVSGDDAYDTKDCHEAIAQRGIQGDYPYPQERQAMDGPAAWCHSPQCHP